MQIKIKQKIGIAIAFSIAMGLLEAAVVIYLRYLLYPQGFLLPLKEMDSTLIITELFREIATVIMLWAVGYLLGANKLSRFAWFMFCFAVWDIFYYVFLYLFINWPSSIFSWDILFLIPVAWFGPVITPCLVATAMIVLALVIVGYEHKGAVIALRKREWGSMLLGCGLILYTFIGPFFNYSAKMGEHWSLPKAKQMVKASLSYVPQTFDWLQYSIGLMIIFAAIILYWRRLHNTNWVSH